MIRQCTKCKIQIVNDTSCPRCNSTAILEGVGVLTSGVGTELINIIPDVFEDKDCDCKSYAKQLDIRGIEWCILNKNEIAQHLVTQAKRYNIPSLCSVPIAKVWVNTAIKRASTLTTPQTQDPNWYVFITTAPREEHTLFQTINSVREAGWEPIIHAEPKSPIIPNVTYRQNDSKLGVWHNWITACKIALNTEAKYILSLQDDIALHPQSKVFTENQLEDGKEYLSLYTPSHYLKHHQPGIWRVNTKSLWGACAMVFSRNCLEQVIAHNKVKSWKGMGPHDKEAKKKFYAARKADPSLIANSDTAIGLILRDLDIPLFSVKPSIARHTSRVSSIKGHGSNTGKRNCKPCANHTQSLWEQIYPVKPILKTEQQPKLDITFTTSLSPTRVEKQLEAINTWKLLGVNVVAIQIEGDTFAKDFLERGVDSIVYVPRRHHKYNRVLIDDHVQYCKKTNQPTILINSDIELHYEQEDFKKYWIDVPKNTLMLGSRWNHPKQQKVCFSKNYHGIDVFRLTPDLPWTDHGFCIGNCMWDYMLPILCYNAGWGFRTDPMPRILHEEHTSHWDREDYRENIEHIESFVGSSYKTIIQTINKIKEIANNNGLAIEKDLPKIPMFFLHIPKTGGISFESAAKGKIDLTRSHLKEGRLPNDTLTCTLLRSPIERVPSLYFYLQRKVDHWNHQKALQTPLDNCSDIDWEFNNGMCRQLTQNYNLQVQPSLSKAKKLLASLDIVGSTNRLHLFAKQINQHIILPIRIGHLNTKPISQQRKLTVSEQIHIAEHNNIDMELWEWARAEFNL